jgi:hypothetical protein
MTKYVAIKFGTTEEITTLTRREAQQVVGCRLIIEYQPVMHNYPNNQRIPLRAWVKNDDRLWVEISD